MAVPTTTTAAARKHQSTTTTTKYQPIHISTNYSQLYQKRHLEMRSMKQKKMVLINKKLRKNKITLNQTETQVVPQILVKYQTATGLGKKKNLRTSSRSCLTSSQALQKLKAFLVWNCLLS